MASALKALLCRPLVRAAITSGSVMTLGDFCCQSIQRRDLSLDKNDWARSLRFGAIGLTLHGPYFHQAFKWLDKKMPPPPTPSLSAAVRKSLYGHLYIFPAYVTAFFLYMGVLEGKSPRQCVQKLCDSFPTTFVTGSVFWPAANLANFMFVPPTGRVAFVATAGLFWNSFLSFVNNRYGQLGTTALTAGGGGGGGGSLGGACSGAGGGDATAVSKHVGGGGSSNSSIGGIGSVSLVATASDQQHQQQGTLQRRLPRDS